MGGDVAAMLEDISRAVRDDDVNLTDWEVHFIQNIRANVTAGFELTPKQDDSLVEIWKKCTGN